MGWGFRGDVFSLRSWRPMGMDMDLDTDHGPWTSIEAKRGNRQPLSLSGGTKLVGLIVLSDGGGVFRVVRTELFPGTQQYCQQ